MTKKSDNHERIVAAAVDSINGVSAVRPVRGTDYSDVLINYKNKDAWLEIKMSHADNLANPRVYYHAETWKTRYSTPVAGIIVNELNKCPLSRDFVYNLADFSNISFSKIYVPTNISEMGAENSVPRETMKKFCTINSKYIFDDQDRDLTDIVEQHYVKGKKEPAYYMQAGDDFYMISNTNPFSLSSSIPRIEGTGKFRVRVSNRSRFYEIQAEIKMKTLVKSDFSLLPGSNKQNPFM